MVGLSMHEDKKTKERMVTAGASAYISKVVIFPQLGDTSEFIARKMK
jgi:DNA-binding NarL/FixJ family response regulator